ncbi:hypothetical protein BH23ACT9_BH23ACT9_17600 [soil metagenome]
MTTTDDPTATGSTEIAASPAAIYAIVSDPARLVEVAEETNRRWQYDLEPIDGGVRVTESTWDRRPDWFAKVTVPFTGVADRATANDGNIARASRPARDRLGSRRRRTPSAG